MGFVDKLRLAQIFGNGMMPGPGAQTLFGGLIPPRVIEEPKVVVKERALPDEVANSSSRGVMRDVPRVRGIDRIGTAPPENKPMNVVYDPTMEIFDKRHKLEKDKFYADREDKMFDNTINKGKLDVDRGKLDVDRSQLEVNVRKQALDEWKARNPEGQIEQGADGKLYVINKVTGAKIDTGLQGADLTEEERIKKNIQGRLDVVDATGKANIALEQERQKKPQKVVGISPSQQRVAEDDAATELLRDERYKWLEKEEIITRDKAGNIVINRPTKGFYGKPLADALGTIDQFERDWKLKAEERMNKARTTGDTIDNNVVDTIQNPDNTMVDMVDSQNRPLKVPITEVEEAKKHGARFVGRE